MSVYFDLLPFHVVGNVNAGGQHLRGDIFAAMRQHLLYACHLSVYCYRDTVGYFQSGRLAQVLNPVHQFACQPFRRSNQTRFSGALMGALSFVRTYGANSGQTFGSSLTAGGGAVKK